MLITASSLALFPKRSFLPDLAITYLLMASDYVSLKSPSIKYGKLGN